MLIAALAAIIIFQNIPPTQSKQTQEHGLMMSNAAITIVVSLSTLPERVWEPWSGLKTHCNVHALWFVPAEVTTDSIVWLDKENCSTNKHCNDDNASSHTTSNFFDSTRQYLEWWHICIFIWSCEDLEVNNNTDTVLPQGQQTVDSHTNKQYLDASCKTIRWSQCTSLPIPTNHGMGTRSST